MATSKKAIEFNNEIVFLTIDFGYEFYFFKKP